MKEEIMDENLFENIKFEEMEEKEEEKGIFD